MKGDRMGKYFEILLIEDNISDVDLVKESLQNNGVICHMNVVNDGFEAMAYLGQQGIYAKATRPDLIILDLNLPKKNGFEVLYKAPFPSTFFCKLSDFPQSNLPTKYRVKNSYNILFFNKNN